MQIKCLIYIVAVLLSIKGYSQINGGSLSLDGGFDISFVEDNYIPEVSTIVKESDTNIWYNTESVASYFKEFIVKVEPNVGYFLFESFEIKGGPVLYYHSLIEKSGLVNYNQKNFYVGVNVGLRKYFGTGVFYPFCGADYQSSYLIKSLRQGGHKGLIYSSILIHVGVLGMLNDKFGLCCELGINKNLTEEPKELDYESSESGYYLSIGCKYFIK